MDPELLRHRVFERSGGALTARVTPHHLEDGTGILILEVPPTLEPVSYRKRLTWRVADNCVDVDPATWYGKMGRPGAEDWSARTTALTVDDVDRRAVDLVRTFPDDANRSEVHEGRNDTVLLRALAGVVADDQNRLTEAGRLLFTRQPAAIDYMHRPVSGAELTIRVREDGPLLVQLAAVLRAMSVRLDTASLLIPGSPVVATHQKLPQRAVREAVVNALVHRDWTQDHPVVVEHMQDRLTVTSPGGFFGTVNEGNLLTHPSLARHPALARAADAAGIAEQQGIGIDRMYLDLLIIGRPSPRIEELDGPRVRVRLYGGEPDVAWFNVHRSIRPRTVGDDLRALIALDVLARQSFVTTRTVAAAIQDDDMEADDVLGRLADARLGEDPVIEQVA